MTKATAKKSVPKEIFQEQRTFARKVLAAEAAAIGRIKLDVGFSRAVTLILENTGGTQRGSVVVSGLGKSGLIGAKISATLASTGTPSHFLHPTEAMHGDLGRIRRGDVMLLLSYTGATDELVSLATILRQDRVPTIALVGKPQCHLATLATVTLPVGDVAEACPLNLAPTASTTAMLALGDALALTVARRRNFGVDDFRKVHPGGGLGKQLLPVTEIMRLKAGENLPVVAATLSVGEALAKAESFAHGGRRVGAFLVVDARGKLVGIFTDGDLRRLVLKRGKNALDEPLRKVMAADPRRLPHTALVRDAVQLAREYRFDEIPVVDDHDKPVGLIDVQDLMALKVIEG